MRIEVAADARLAARLAAHRLADTLRAAVAARGRAAIAVSGGTTPARMLECLASEALPWPDVHVFQVDERIAARDHAARNLGPLLAAFAACDIPAAHIHAMPVEAPDADAAARTYSAELEHVLGPALELDAVHLGLGLDGHTASLVPGDPALEAAEHVALTRPYEGTRRMTLTLGMLNRARKRLWLVTGESKRAVLARLVDGDRALVAARVNRDDSIVVADAAAARRDP